MLRILTVISTYLSVFEVNLVSQHNEGEVFRIPGTGLDEKLISPTIEGFERVGGSNVKDQNAAVCASVEGHAEGLEPLLACRVPDLRETTHYSLGGTALGLGDAGGAAERQAT